MYRKILIEAIVDTAVDYFKTYVYPLETLTGRRIKFDDKAAKKQKPAESSNCDQKNWNSRAASQSTMKSA